MFGWKPGRDKKSVHASNGLPVLKCECSPESQNDAKTLADIEPGQSVQICCLDGNGPLLRRLSEMGFIPGTTIEVVRRAPLNDPIEFHLRGYLVSLRWEEARSVRVRTLQPIANTIIDLK